MLSSQSNMKLSFKLVCLSQNAIYVLVYSCEGLSMKNMDIEKYSNWITKSDVCRCCLSSSGTWNLTSMYITDAGIKHIFADLLTDCLGISISNLSTCGSSQLICQLCINQLQDAANFREQVVHSEKVFLQYWADRTEEKENDSNPSTKITSKNTLKKRYQIQGTKNESTSEYDSDTPISEIKVLINIKEEIDVSSPINCNIKRNIHMNDVDDSKKQFPIRAKVINKNVSERRRLILTCGTVLKETTACPFRHHKSWFQCFFCSQDFMEINLLRDHTLIAHPDIEMELKKIKRYPRSLQIDISNLECRNCHLKLTDVESMKDHFIDIHKKIIYKECIADYKVNSSPYTCHICKREFHVFRTLTTHLNEHYPNCICDVCGKSFINSKRLKVHKRTHENGNYPCSECGKILKTKTSKANHMESAHSKRVIKCQICYKPMKHYNDRIKHMSEAHNITNKFKCPICGREYNIKHYLATHIRQTHGNKNKKCNECGMAFITNYGLKKHMTRHTGEKPFTCRVCCKSYARSYTLREHMKCHENKRLFP